jgi:hypothetical protein
MAGPEAEDLSNQNPKQKKDAYLDGSFPPLASSVIVKLLIAWGFDRAPNTPAG